MSPYFLHSPLSFSAFRLFRSSIFLLSIRALLILSFLFFQTLHGFSARKAFLPSQRTSPSSLSLTTSDLASSPVSLGCPHAHKDTKLTAASGPPHSGTAPQSLSCVDLQNPVFLMPQIPSFFASSTSFFTKTPLISGLFHLFRDHPLEALLVPLVVRQLFTKILIVGHVSHLLQEESASITNALKNPK